MDQQFDIPRLITLRKLTSALSDHFAKQVAEYLSHLAPLLHPRTILGELIRGEKLSVRGQDLAFQELLKLYQSVGPARPFNTLAELKPPLDIFGSTPEITPASYLYTPAGSSKKITIRQPLKWVLAYKDLSPQRLRELVVSHNRSGGMELQSALLHYLVIHQITSKDKGIGPIFTALRLPFVTETTEEFAKLPLTCVTLPISTVRPPDDVIVMNTEIAGTSTFEEVIDLEDFAKLSDPLADQVMAIVGEQAGNLLAELERPLSE